MLKPEKVSLGCSKEIGTFLEDWGVNLDDLVAFLGFSLMNPSKVHRLGN